MIGQDSTSGRSSVFSIDNPATTSKSFLSKSQELHPCHFAHRVSWIFTELQKSSLWALETTAPSYSKHTLWKPQCQCSPSMNQSRFEPLPGLDCCMFQSTVSWALLVSSQKAMQTRKSTWSGILHRQLHSGFSKASFTRVFERPLAAYFDFTFFCWKQPHERIAGTGGSYLLDL